MTRAPASRLLHARQFRVELAAHPIDRLLGQHRRSRQLAVLLVKRVGRVVHHGDRCVRHRLKWSVGDRRPIGFELQQAARDRLGVIADALELAAESDRRIPEPQMPGGGLLADQELQAEAIELLFRFVDLLIAQDDQVRGLSMAANERF
jgi:hypothetical protein